MLVAWVLLFIFRRVVQDREHVDFREHTPATPEEEAALLGVEPARPAVLPA